MLLVMLKGFTHLQEMSYNVVAEYQKSQKNGNVLTVITGGKLAKHALMIIVQQIYGKRSKEVGS